MERSEIQARQAAAVARTEAWAAPARYGDPAEEHRFARTAAAVIDRSGIGRIKVTGRDRLDFLHRLCTQDLKKLLAPGRGAPAVFTTNKGRIVDFVSVFDLGETLLLLTSPGGRAVLPAWIRKYIVTDQVQLTDVTLEGGAFRVTGPLAPQVLRALGSVPASAIEPYRILGVAISGIETAVIGEEAGPRPSFLVIAEAPGIASLFEMAVSDVRAAGGGPAGEEARNVLRIEDGLPEAGAELTEDFNPWEARLDAAISLSKGCYIGQEIVARLNTYDKVTRRLVGFRMGQAALPPPGSRVFSPVEGEEGGQQVGVLTSSTRSFQTGETIGLGYVRLAWERPGTEVQIVSAMGGADAPATRAAEPAPAAEPTPAGGERIPARVTSLPVVP